MMRKSRNRLQPNLKRSRLPLTISRGLLSRRRFFKKSSISWHSLNLMMLCSTQMTTQVTMIAMEIWQSSKPRMRSPLRNFMSRWQTKCSSSKLWRKSRRFARRKSLRALHRCKTLCLLEKTLRKSWWRRNRRASEMTPRKTCAITKRSGC